VVTSNVTSLPEVVGEAARLVSPDNVFEIMRGMKDVLLDEELRRELRGRGLERLRHFNWTQTAREVLQVYREATGQRS
jgi:glycosyltransferase involved in cell wall biosynthesis